MSYKIYTDGGSRPNPGPCGWGVVIYENDFLLFEGSYGGGVGTNNIAEWNALLTAVQKMAELGLQKATIYTDSNLVLKQAKGEYKIKNRSLQNIFQKYTSFVKNHQLNLTLKKVAAHTGIEGNEVADRLATKGLQEQKVSEFLQIKIIA